MPNSVRFNRTGTTGSLARTTNLPASTACTIMGWFNAITQTNNRTLFTFGGASATYYVQLDGTNIKLDNSTDVFTGGAFAVSRWYHVAFVGAGTGANTALLYRDAVVDISMTGVVTGTPNSLFFGNTAGGGGDSFLGYMAALKIFNFAMTSGEIAAEMPYAMPVSRGGLNSAYPLGNEWDVANLDAALLRNSLRRWADVSGQAGNDLTESGTLDMDLGPPIQFAPSYRQRRSRIADTVTPPSGGKPDLYYRMLRTG